MNRVPTIESIRSTFRELLPDGWKGFLSDLLPEILNADLECRRDDIAEDRLISMNGCVPPEDPWV